MSAGSGCRPAAAREGEGGGVCRLQCLCLDAQLTCLRLHGRVLDEGETALQPDEQALLDRICEAYYLPAWCSVADYARRFEAQGMQVRQLVLYIASMHGAISTGKCPGCSHLC